MSHRWLPSVCRNSSIPLGKLPPSLPARVSNTSLPLFHLLLFCPLSTHCGVDFRFSPSLLVGPSCTVHRFFEAPRTGRSQKQKSSEFVLLFSHPLFSKGFLNLPLIIFFFVFFSSVAPFFAPTHDFSLTLSLNSLGAVPSFRVRMVIPPSPNQYPLPRPDRHSYRSPPPLKTRPGVLWNPSLFFLNPPFSHLRTPTGVSPSPFFYLDQHILPSMALYTRGNRLRCFRFPSPVPIPPLKVTYLHFSSPGQSVPNNQVPHSPRLAPPTVPPLSSYLKESFTSSLVLSVFPIRRVATIGRLVHFTGAFFFQKVPCFLLFVPPFDSLTACCQLTSPLGTSRDPPFGYPLLPFSLGQYSPQALIADAAPLPLFLGETRSVVVGGPFPGCERLFVVITRVRSRLRGLASFFESQFFLEIPLTCRR